MTWRDEWPSARVETLRAMHAAGSSASEIAARISAYEGITVTRNAVIGKINRLKLSKPVKAEPSPEEMQSKRYRRRQQQNGYQRDRRRAASASKIVAFKPSFNRPPRAEKKIVQELAPLNLMLADLTMKDGRPAECRLITNDDLANATYCGHAVDAEASWCPYHRVKLQPPKGWTGSKYLPKIACAA